MKKHTKALFCIIISLLFLSAGNVRADELVRLNSDELTSSGSIIRHYDGDTDIVCYHSPEGPFFMMYINGVPSTNVLYLQPMDTIHDFEIYEDTVYFCGNGNINRVGDAVVGYFAVADLTNLSLSNVAYITLPALETVKAIEVGWFASRKHVVGVGKAINSEGMMVDMIDESAYWDVNLGEVGGDTIALSDLAITRTYVVVTSTKNAIGTVVPGRLWLIEKPTTAGASLFPGSVTFYDHGTDVGSKYLVRTRCVDEFVTAHGPAIYSIGTTPFTVSYYNGPSYVESAYINESPATTCSLGDINCEDGTFIVNMLLHGMYQTGNGLVMRSMIYELDYIALPATVKAHVYDGVVFESLAPIWAYNIDEQHFVSSGYKPYGYGTPYYLKYHTRYFEGECLEMTENLAKKVIIDHKPTTKEIESTLTRQVPIVIESYRKYMRVNTECFSQTPTPVYDGK